MNASVRLAGIDGARAVGIILVVVGHEWRGLWHAGILTDPQLYRTVDSSIYAFHMPLMFIISGIFAARVGPDWSAWREFLQRSRRLLWPLVLWTYIFLFLRYLGSLVGVANAPITSADMLRWPLPPYEHVWFLWQLFVLSVGLIALKAIRRDIGRLPWFWLAFSILALFAQPPWGLVTSAVNSASAFGVGVLIGFRPAALQRSPAQAVLALVLFAALLVFGPPASQPGAQDRALGIALSLALLVAIASFYPRIAGGWAGQGLGEIGRATMPIYVMHTMVMAPVRTLAYWAGIQAPAVHLLIGTVAGILGPIAIYLLARRLSVARTLGFD